jgi:predicted glycosyltransferase
VRFLFDLSHPAHVHFFRFIRSELEGAGHETSVVARDVDVTIDLLHGFGIPFTLVPRAHRTGLAGLALELARRDWALVRIARDFRPDVIVTRNPAGVQAARLARVHGVFDTDDGRAVGIHFRAAAPFAHTITSPDCIRESFGPKHVKYPSYKAMAFLHPSRFTPDATVRDELGVQPDERYFVVRSVALESSHDRGEQGFGTALLLDLVDRLSNIGRVFISSEGPLPRTLAPLALPTKPHRMHDVLAFSHLVVVDGQSVAAEAAILGVPAVRYASTRGRIAYLADLEARYGLVAEFAPGSERPFLDRVDEWATEVDCGWRRQAHAQLLDEKCDLTGWMTDFLTSLPR